MENIIYIEKIPLAKKIIGFLISLFGLYTIIFLNLVFGAIFLFLGINLLKRRGIEIDPEVKSYRKLISILGFNFGKWMPCPAFEYISVFKTVENRSLRVVTAETTLRNDIIVVNLFYNGNRHLTLFKTEDEQEAFEVAKRLKLIYHIDILDATQRESKWA